MKGWIFWNTKINNSLWQESNIFDSGFFLLWWKSYCQRSCEESRETLIPFCFSFMFQSLEDSLIAFRTRSKRPLKDVPLGQLEAELRAPDITPDMYDPNTADDEEWKRWLGGLMNDDVENEGTYNTLLLIGTEGSWRFFLLFLATFSSYCSWYSWLDLLSCLAICMFFAHSFPHLLYRHLWDTWS